MDVGSGPQTIQTFWVPDPAKRITGELSNEDSRLVEQMQQMVNTSAERWAGRYREFGPAGMADRSSRPRSCPHQLPVRTERRILGLRVARRWGPARIAYRLGLAVSTVQRVLARYGAPPLRFTDPATGARVRSSRPAPRRFISME